MAAIRRRQWLQAAAAGTSLMMLRPQFAFAQAATERRFIFIIQRGAADGLNTVVPYADPAYAALRRELAVDPAAALRLDGLFALHPSLAETGKLYGAKQALFVHAVASPYRDRSHFDGQNVLETGGTAAFQLADGWMNRMVRLLPGHSREAVAFAPTVPMALRGAAEVTSYAPSALPAASEDLLLQVQQLYANDAQLRAIWAQALQTRDMAGLQPAGVGMQDPGVLGRAAARLMAQPRGPRLAMIETGGWDTHSAQKPRLAAQLKSLDAMVAALCDGLGAAWNQTVVLVATEFGRTAAANGTGGTDHGTGSAAMLIGGAVQGGRVVSDWPGLAAGSLYEGRDLHPTLSLDQLIASTAAECFSLDPQIVVRTLFPQLQPGTALLPQLLRT